MNTNFFKYTSPFNIKSFVSLRGEVIPIENFYVPSFTYSIMSGNTIGDSKSVVLVVFDESNDMIIDFKNIIHNSTHAFCSSLNAEERARKIIYIIFSHIAKNDLQSLSFFNKGKDIDFVFIIQRKNWPEKNRNNIYGRIFTLSNNDSVEAPYVVKQSFPIFPKKFFERFYERSIKRLHHNMIDISYGDVEYIEKLSKKWSMIFEKINIDFKMKSFSVKEGAVFLGDFVPEFFNIYSADDFLEEIFEKHYTDGVRIDYKKFEYGMNSFELARAMGFHIVVLFENVFTTIRVIDIFWGDIIRKNIQENKKAKIIRGIKISVETCEKTTDFKNKNLFLSSSWTPDAFPQLKKPTIPQNPIINECDDDDE